MSTTSRHRMKSLAVIDKCQVEIVDLKGSYSRSAGSKWAAILDGTELCRVEEFAARHFRRSGFEAVFLESAPFQVLFGVYFWSVIQDRCDRRVRMVGILDRHAYDQRQPSEVIWIQLPSDFGSLDYSRRRAKAITKHLSAIAETTAELLELFDNWLAPSVGLRQYLWAVLPVIQDQITKHGFENNWCKATPYGLQSQRTKNWRHFWRTSTQFH